MRGHAITLESVLVRFGNVTAVEPTDLAIEAGEFFSILGPSGCGKTTLLRVISGFLAPTAGKVRIGGEDVTTMGPADRPTAMIFQSLALFPHMTIWENVAFGLEARGISRAARRAKAEELLALVALLEHAAKKPSELSGGQRQRVAIARALAVDPAVLLLDEPLSALDLKLRQHMRAELKAIQRRTGVTFVYITHDQGEALAMSDRVAVMSRGRIEQVATPDVLYAKPASPFVATFVGEQNVMEGRVAATQGNSVLVDTPLGALKGLAQSSFAHGERVKIMVRPERIALQASLDDDMADAHADVSIGANVLLAIRSDRTVPQPKAFDGNRLKGRFMRRDMEGPTEVLIYEVGGCEWQIHRHNRGESAHERTDWLLFDEKDALVFGVAP